MRISCCSATIECCSTVVFSKHHFVWLLQYQFPKAPGRSRGRYISVCVGLSSRERSAREIDSPQRAIWQSSLAFHELWFCWPTTSYSPKDSSRVVLDRELMPPRCSARLPEPLQTRLGYACPDLVYRPQRQPPLLISRAGDQPRHATTSRTDAVESTSSHSKYGGAS